MSRFTCPSCGVTQEVYPDSAPIYGMNDDHTFKKYDKAKNVDDLLSLWREDIAKGHDISLCPVRVYAGKKQIREVGKMLHPDYRTRQPKDETAVEAFRIALKCDPDIPRLMATQ